MLLFAPKIFTLMTVACGKLESPTVNITRFGKLVSVTAIPIFLSPPQKIVSVAGFLGNEIKN
jgi:hypothetical protein